MVFGIPRSDTATGTRNSKAGVGRDVDQAEDGFGATFADIRVEQAGSGSSLPAFIRICSNLGLADFGLRATVGLAVAACSAA